MVSRREWHEARLVAPALSDREGKSHSQLPSAKTMPRGTGVSEQRAHKDHLSEENVFCLSSPLPFVFCPV